MHLIAVCARVKRYDSFFLIGVFVVINRRTPSRLLHQSVATIITISHLSCFGIRRTLLLFAIISYPFCITHCLAKLPSQGMKTYVFICLKQTLFLVIVMGPSLIISKFSNESFDSVLILFSIYFSQSLSLTRAHKFYNQGD